MFAATAIIAMTNAQVATIFPTHTARRAAYPIFPMVPNPVVRFPPSARPRGQVAPRVPLERFDPSPPSPAGPASTIFKGAGRFAPTARPWIAGRAPRLCRMQVPCHAKKALAFQLFVCARGRRM
jgi:hypothetical protein